MESSAKKRIMYLSGEDYYYFTYSILLILKGLGCKDGKFFKDYRKLPFLIEILNDDGLLFILERYTSPDDLNGDLEASVARKLNVIDHEHLFRSYTTGMARRSEILKLLFTLEKSGYVTLRKGDHELEIDVALNFPSVPKEFFKSNVFFREVENIKLLKKLVKRLSVLTFSTMIEKIYSKNGVRTWAL